MTRTDTVSNAMDNQSLLETINKIPILKYKYIGSFPANFIPLISKNTFCIINTDASDKMGSHWIMLANKEGKFYYGDSMGYPISKYKDIQFPFKTHRLVVNTLQTGQYCGLYCIYFACKLFSGKIPDQYISDYEVVKFMCLYL